MTPAVKQAIADLAAVINDLEAIDIDILVKYHDVEPLAARHVRQAMNSLDGAAWHLRDDRGDADV